MNWPGFSRSLCSRHSRGLRPALLSELKALSAYFLPWRLSTPAFSWSFFSLDWGAELPLEDGHFTLLGSDRGLSAVEFVVESMRSSLASPFPKGGA